MTQDLFIVSTGGILDKAAAVLVRLVHAVHGVVTAALRGHTLPALRGTKVENVRYISIFFSAIEKALIRC